MCDRFWKAHREGKPGWSFQTQFCELGGWEMKSFCMFCGRTKKQEEEFHFHCHAAGRKPSIIFNLHVFVCLHFWGSSSSCSFSCPLKAGDGAGRLSMKWEMQRGERPREGGKRDTRATKARTQGTSASLFRLKCVCEALQDSGGTGGRGSAPQRLCRSWWEFSYKGAIVWQQRLTEIQWEKWRRKKRGRKETLFCNLRPSEAAPVAFRAATALGASGLC